MCSISSHICSSSCCKNIANRFVLNNLGNTENHGGSRGHIGKGTFRFLVVVAAIDCAATGSTKAHDFIVHGGWKAYFGKG